MSNPPPYDRDYSFTAFQQGQGDNSFPGTEIDAEFDDVAETTDAIIAALADVRRDDGKINPDALPPGYTSTAEAIAAAAEAEAAAAAAQASAEAAAASAAAADRSPPLVDSTYRILSDRSMSRRETPFNATGDLKRVVYHILLLAQSKPIGTNTGGLINGIGNEIDPTRVFMPQYALADGTPVVNAGPLQFGFPKIVEMNTGLGLVPCAESMGVTVPDLPDTDGSTIVFGTTLGQSMLSSIGFGFVEAMDRNFGDERTLVCVSGTGHGGYFYNQLKRGGALFNQLRYQTKTVKQLVEDKGYVYKLAALFYNAGTADAGGTLANQAGFETTNASRRDRTIQLRADFAEMAREATNDASLDPIVWIPADASTVPGSFPLVDGQVANIVQGDIDAFRLDSRVRVPYQEYAYANSDPLHLTRWAVWNAGYQAGTVMAQNEGGVGAELPFLPIAIRPKNELQDLVIYDTAKGPLRVGAWTADRIAIANGGTGFPDGALVEIGGDSALDSPAIGRAVSAGGVIAAVDISGTLAAADPGAFAAVQAGNRSIKRKITGVEKVSGGTGYGAAFNFTINEGTQSDPGDMLAGATNGVVEIIRITRLPTWVGDPPTGTLTTTGLGSGGMGGSGFTVQLTPSSGAGATGRPQHLTQMAVTRNWPDFTTAKGNIPTPGGVAIPVGTELTQSGASNEIPAEGTRAVLVVSSSNGTGMTGGRIRVGGCYDYDNRPTGTVTFTNGTYTVGVTLDPEQWGGWPVSDSDPGTLGFAEDDGTPNPPRVVRAELTGAGGPAYRNAILVTKDKASNSANRILGYAIVNTGTAGPEDGRRGLVHQRPLSPRRGKTGQFAQRRAQPFWQNMPGQPALDTRPEPIVANGDFQWWPNDITSVAIPANGQQVGSVFATQGTDDAMVISRVAGGGMQVQRAAGQSDGSAMCVTPVNLKNAEARKLRGDYITITFDAIKGADYSEPSSQITSTIYAADTVGALSTSNGTPSGGSSAGSLVATLTTSWQTFSFRSAAVVADTTNQIAVRFLGDPPATAAGTDDWFRIRNLRIDRGVAVTAPRSESVHLSALRALEPTQIEALASVTGPLPARKSKRTVYTASSTHVKDANAVMAHVRYVGGGGGGGGGGVAGSGTAVTGGGGGGAASVVDFWTATADMLTSTTVTIGNGGTGGAAGSSAGGSGGDGGIGGSTLFGALSSGYPVAYGGGGGSGGSASTASAGGGGGGIRGAGGSAVTSTAGTAGAVGGTAGGSGVAGTPATAPHAGTGGAGGGATGAQGNAGAAGADGPGSGASGGGINTANTAFNGGGSTAFGTTNGTVAGGTAPGGAGATNGTTMPKTYASGGAGGASAVDGTTSGGAGGAGQIGGGGGGGGGAARTGAAGGAGAAGGGGYLIVEEFY